MYSRRREPSLAKPVQRSGPAEFQGLEPAPSDPGPASPGQAREVTAAWAVGVQAIEVSASKAAKRSSQAC